FRLRPGNRKDAHGAQAQRSQGWLFHAAAELWPRFGWIRLSSILSMQWVCVAGPAIDAAQGNWMSNRGNRRNPLQSLALLGALALVVPPLIAAADAAPAAGPAQAGNVQRGAKPKAAPKALPRPAPKAAPKTAPKVAVPTPRR